MVVVQELTDALESALGVRSLVPLIQGGQKFVFTAVMSGQEVVVKVVSVPAGPQGDITRTRAHREVELLAAVDSPHVVKVLTDAVELTTPLEAVAWVEERLDGQDLGAILRPAWSDSDVRSLVSDLAEGLAACHDLGVVHRDLSPGNVRRTNLGRFVLMDPGLARHLEKTALTGNYQPGTDGFRSPEHVPGGECVPASDIFALGILAFYALTGELPVDAGAPDYQVKLTSVQAPSVRTKRLDVSQPLARVVDRCLQLQPARRYLDGPELLSDLEGWTD
ncbi:serine/threonine-protein kinase [Knoellia remsis]|uniref:serine/threonine-protein kinase n=1 Tax=Knoellia remsis TaxID=407159 RepID=UPI000D06B555|nr:serine/threonine-protein kinase [Knoellia remsis]